MNRKLPFTPEESADLSAKLEEHLVAMFTNGGIDKYNTGDHTQPDREMVLDDWTSMEALPCIRSAYHIWSAMYTEDRYAVLQTFSLLYVGRPNTLPYDEPTIAFCMVFINELASVLTEAAQWPH